MKSFKMITILSLLLISNIVNAHSSLINSSPEKGAVLKKFPESVILEFSMPVKLVKLELISSSKEVIKLITKPSQKFDLIFNIELPVLDSGSYKVKWVAMGKDTHKMKGHFTFMLAPSRNN